MDLFTMLLAFEPLQKLYQFDLPFQKSKKVMELVETIKPDCQFFADQERKLAERYAEKENERLKIKNGKIAFSDPEKMQCYIEEINKLRRFELTWNFPKIKISESEMGTQKISAEDIERLKPFVEIGGT